MNEQNKEYTKLMHDEIKAEEVAVLHFLSLASMAEGMGLHDLAKSCLEYAKEDCEHRLEYARQLDMIDELTLDKTYEKYTPLTIIEKIIEMEKNAADRINDIIKSKGNVHYNDDFLIKSMNEHLSHYYDYSKLYMKAKGLYESKDLEAFDKLFSSEKE